MKRSLVLVGVFLFLSFELAGQGRPIRVRNDAYWISGDSLLSEAKLDSILENPELRILFDKAISSRMLARKMFFRGLAISGVYLLISKMTVPFPHYGSIPILVLQSTLLIVGSTALITSAGVQIYAIGQRKKFRNQLKDYDRESQS